MTVAGSNDVPPRAGAAIPDLHCVAVIMPCLRAGPGLGQAGDAATSDATAGLAILPPQRGALMLVAFEGQDGAGKTALLVAVQQELERRRVACRAVEEFSGSPYGQRLVRAAGRDTFLRPVANEAATALTRALEIVADLYFFDQCVIQPALQRGQVVLKDRHLDTILYTLVPTLRLAGAVSSEERALTWLSVLMSELRHRPYLTVYVDAPIDVRLDRIAARTRHLQDHHASEVSAEEVHIFTERERIARRLIAEEPHRFLVLDNADRPLPEVATRVVDVICARLAATS